MTRLHPKILLVDTDIGFNSLLSQHLIASGFDAKTATNGEQALTIISTWRPTLVVTDLKIG